MYFGKIALYGLVSLAACATALACVGEPEWQLFADRDATLKMTPVNGFDFEVNRITGKAKDNLVAKEQEPETYWDDKPPPPEVLAIEARELGEALAKVAGQARAAKSGDEAYAIAAPLAMDARLYIAGAVDFRLKRYGEAQKKFAAVLAMPERDRKLRSVWAQYMLGRVAAAEEKVDEAIKAFQATRALALVGWSDPMALGVASYGEEARVHLNAAKRLYGEPLPSTPENPADTEAVSDPLMANAPLPAKNAKAYRREMVAAADLYRQQLAHDSKGALASLQRVAVTLLTRPDRIEAAAPDAFLQQLMVYYALSSKAGGEDDPRPGPGVWRVGTLSMENLKALGNAVAALDHPADTDRFAVLQYEIGNYEAAGKLIAKSDTPTAVWLQAKLAVRGGDLAGAAKLYHRALQNFPEKGLPVLEETNWQLMAGEFSVVAMARGEYVLALDTLVQTAGKYPVFWDDIVHIAQHVLTTDELIAYVDAKVSAPKIVLRKSDDPDLPGWQIVRREDKDHLAWAPEGSLAKLQLRYLLARRLMRDGRYDEALRYFDQSEYRKFAADFITAVRLSEKAPTKVERATALWQAAYLQRHKGLEMMGTEEDMYDGRAAEVLPAKPFITTDEIARYGKSLPMPNARWHYRYGAMDKAEAAAQLTPPKSEAFAAVLCHATDWSTRTEGDEAGRKYYREYVAKGARFKWVTHFGHHCPMPDFKNLGAAKTKAN
jgi:tetratricopeptide (TPR) repeat protein